jgi:peptidyl-prolyl cis-trans isomerase D
MLRTMRESSRWIMWVVIVGVGAVFVLYLGIGGRFRGQGGPGTVVDVDGRRFTARDVFRVREQLEAQQRSALGDAFDAKGASEFLDEMAASMLLRTALLAREAEQMGLRASDEEVRSYVKRWPGATDESGHLDRRALTYHAERNFGTVKRFEEAVRDDLLVQKFNRLLSESVDVSEAEAREALRYRRTEVRIAYVRFDGSKPPENLEISQEKLDAFLTDEAERVRTAYDERSSEYDRPEEVRARHILVKLPEDADAETEAAARARMDKILERIRGGADFADVAMEMSEDPGTRDKGGDLGFFPRGRMVPAFEKVAFSLEPGEMSGVIRTPNGLHLIRVEERRAAMVVPFEEVRDEIARDLIREDAAMGVARKRAEELAAEIRQGHSLLEAARKARLSIERTDAIRHRPDSYIPGLGAAPEVISAAFALSEEHPSSPEIFEVQGDQLVLIQLLERTEPPDEEIEPLVEEERQRLITERRAQLERDWIAKRQDALAKRGKIFYSLKPMER